MGNRILETGDRGKECIIDRANLILECLIIVYSIQQNILMILKCCVSLGFVTSETSSDALTLCSFQTLDITGCSIILFPNAE